MIFHLILLISYTKAEVYDFKNELLAFNSPCSLKIQSKKYTSIDGNILKKFKQVKTLSISSTSISDIPDGIEELTKLEELVFVDNEVGENMLNLEKLTNLPSLIKLNLSGNKIKRLSDSIGLLSSLKYLYLSKNELVVLPNQITELKHLLTLDISFNLVKELPHTIGNLVNLSTFNANNNGLSTLCNDFVKLFQLCKISLDNNMFQEIPIQLFALKNLEYISLAKNQIEKISCPRGEVIDNLCNDKKTANKIKQIMYMHTHYGTSFSWLSEYNESNIGYYLSKLTYLNLSGNRIFIIPDSIAYFNKLFYLQLHNNNIEKVSSAIKTLTALSFLDLSCNNLKYLPLEICLLTKIYYLNLKCNDIELENKLCLTCKTYDNLGVRGLKSIGIPKLIFDDDILTRKQNKRVIAKLKQSQLVDLN